MKTRSQPSLRLLAEYCTYTSIEDPNPITPRRMNFLHMVFVRKTEGGREGGREALIILAVAPTVNDCLTQSDAAEFPLCE